MPPSAMRRTFHGTLIAIALNELVIWPQSKRYPDGNGVYQDLTYYYDSVASCTKCNEMKSGLAQIDANRMYLHADDPPC